MKCYYAYDEEAGKVLIPGCWNVVHSNDMSQCTCRNKNSFIMFEKDLFNQVLKEKEQLISDLEKENASLNRIIKRLIIQKLR